MQYTKLKILGYRGFSKLQVLNLAIPNNKAGSGLTVIVGPNNSGKSTIFESFKAISQNEAPSFTEGRRNKKAKYKISIKLYTNKNDFVGIETLGTSGSETQFIENNIRHNQIKIMTLPSRRSFAPYFGKGTWERDTYIKSSKLPAIRGSQLDNFQYRIFNIQKNIEQLENFNKVLQKVLSPTPNWYVEQEDSGSYYIKFNFNGLFHNSDGAGEGLLSLFTIIDTLYDSNENDTIVIDEPELSLHPAIQRKLIELFIEYSATRQIILSTHSPYFINWESILNGGMIARTVKFSDGSLRIYQLQDLTIKGLKGLLNNSNNPHILGLEAKEIFFLDDKIILVEGQEDVVYIKKIFRLLNLNIQGTFYGWGAGGAANIPKILNVFNDLGFKKCSVILDNNMSRMKNSIFKRFPGYKVIVIPTDDIRDKNAINAKPAIKGLINTIGNTLNPEYKIEIINLIEQLNEYFLNNNSN